MSKVVKQYVKDDFEFGKVLGEGAYSQVYMATLKENGSKYAVKVVEKQKLVRENKVKTVKNEKEVLSMLRHPNIVNLFCTFHDADNLYFALEFCSGGEMFKILSKYGPFSVEATRFYAAEIILALEFMHNKNVIHRDMKPENILFDSAMHIKLTDFGTAKVLGREDINKAVDDETKAANTRKGTFCGTAEYVSPEILKDLPVDKGCDLWALGCIIFQMLSGAYPFRAPSAYLTFQKILNRQFEFPPCIPTDARDLIDKLLHLEPAQRLGCGPNGYYYLKRHPFFKDVDWERLQYMTPPTIIRPEVDKPKHVTTNSNITENTYQGSPKISTSGNSTSGAPSNARAAAEKEQIEKDN